MKKFSLALALALLPNATSQAIAQTDASVQIAPCKQETPARSVLKRKITQSGDQSTTELAKVETSNSQPCDNSSVESNSRSDQKLLTIKFEGLAAVAESDLRKYLGERRIHPTADLATDVTSLTKAQEAITELLTSYGNRRSQVSSRLDNGGGDPPVLTFVISEGPRFEISELQFEGNRVFSDQLLAAEVRKCVAGYQKDSGNVFRPDIFEYCIHNLANFERSQGYLQAKFGKPKIEEVGEAVVLTIQADEGPLYRLGRLEIEGADHVAEPDIRAMLDVRRGDVTNGEKIAKAFYEDLKAVYGEKGFIQYTAEIQPEFHSEFGATEGVVNLKITIDEGRRFRVRKISFKGAHLPENDLRQMLLLREGKVYNQKLFEQSVTRINETGSFNWVDKDKDVDYRTNEEEGLLSIVINVTRRSPPM